MNMPQKSVPVLYGSPISPFVRKVAVVLEEKGIDYTWKPVRPHDRDEEFQKISPLGKIPAYRDEKIALADSSVINFYLEKTYPDKPLYPIDTIELAKALWFEEYFDSALIVPMRTIYFEKFFNPKFLGKPTVLELLREAEEVTLPPMLAYLEAELRPDQWIVGNQFSIADISLAVGFADLDIACVDINMGLFPKLAAYVRRIHSRASFTKCAAFTQRFVKKMEEKLAAVKNT